jgi:hypothetical protein
MCVKVLAFDKWKSDRRKSLVQDLMLILNPWGFDVSELSPQTRASVHLSASLCLSNLHTHMAADCQIVGGYDVSDINYIKTHFTSKLCCCTTNSACSCKCMHPCGLQDFVLVLLSTVIGGSVRLEAVQTSASLGLVAATFGHRSMMPHPVLSGHGVDDRLVPAMMTEALQRLMPGSHMHLREGAQYGQKRAHAMLAPCSQWWRCPLSAMHANERATLAAKLANPACSRFSKLSSKTRQEDVTHNIAAGIVLS